MDPGHVVAERFEIERLAGSGGMGEVYRARDRVAQRPVALKVLRGAGGGDEPRFLREAAVLASLEHPAIVRFVAHGITPRGERFLAMEWLEGEGLSAHLRGTRLGAAASVDVALQVAAALAHVHRRGIVHRDIKPSNLFLVDRDPRRLKLIDFGIARVASAARLTQTGATLGTPGYMAPEQARGEPQVEAPADVFSLGCVLFRCLTGRRPFTGSDVLAVLLKLTMEDAPRLRDVAPELPEALDELLARMLARRPGQRPPHGDAVLASLEALRGSIALSAVRSAPSRVPSLPDTERRVLALVVVRTPFADDDATLTEAATDARAATMRGVAARHHCRVEVLGADTAAIAVVGADTATDLARRAARCALALRAALDEASIAVVVGRGVLEADAPLGELIDRAVALLAVVTRGIAVDELTAGLLTGRFDVEGTPAGFWLRGELDAEDDARPVLGRRTPCLGRDRELSSLAAFFDECAEEPRARAVLITAGEGVGKSRLRQELVRRVREKHAPEIWVARGDPLSAGAAFSLLADALRGAFGISGADDPAARRARIRARVLQRAPADGAGRVAEFLGELCGVPFPDEGRVQLRAARRDPVLMGDQMRRAFEDFLLAECAGAPVLLVLEDLQWGDLPTTSFVDSALSACADAPFMVLALGRPAVRDLFPDLWATRNFAELRLGPLGAKAAWRLASEMLGDAAPSELVTRLVERAGGNAFYLEELARASAAGRSELPETILAMAEVRLASLRPELRRVLRAASVFGRRFTAQGVAALVGDGESGASIAAQLAELTRCDVIARRAEASAPDAVDYDFRSALLRDAAYAMLPPEDRALGHRLAGAWLERVGDGDAGALAEHFERGGEPAAAARWYRAAAKHAMGGDDLRGGVALLERGLAALDAAGDGVGPGDRAALEVPLAEAHLWLGQNSEAEAPALAGLAGAPPGSELFFRAAAGVALVSGRLARLDRLASVARALLDAPLDDALAGVACQAFARTSHHLLGASRGDLAAALLARIDELAGRGLVNDPEALVQVCGARAFAALLAGDPAENLRQIRAALGHARACGNERAHSNVLGTLGYAHLALGDHEAAEANLRAALVAGGRLKLSKVVGDAKHNLGIVLARQGRFAEALAVEGESLAGFCAQGNRPMEAAARTYLAMIHELSGDAASAEREARAAVELAQGSDLRAITLGVLSRVLLRGRPAEALAAGREARALLGSTGGEVSAVVRLAHAEAEDAAGDPAEARRAIAEARARLLASAARISDPALRASFLSRVPESARTLALAAAWLGDSPDGLPAHLDRARH